MTVISFPTEETPEPQSRADYIMKCDCGCMSFNVHVSTGFFVCTSCSLEYQDDLPCCEKRDDWVREVESSSEVENTHQFEGDEFALRLVLAEATKGLPDLAALVVMKKNGRTLVWSDGYETEEEISWFQRRVDVLMGMLK